MQPCFAKLHALLSTCGYEFIKDYLHCLCQCFVLLLSG